MRLSSATLCTLFAYASVISQRGFAVVEDSPVAQRLAVVGVIAEAEGGQGTGIAVLKDIKGGRTFAVQTGETLPGEPLYTLRSVRKNAVVVSDGKNQVTLSYDVVEAPAREASADGPSDSDLGPDYWEKVYRDLAGISRAGDGGIGAQGYGRRGSGIRPLSDVTRGDSSRPGLTGSEAGESPTSSFFVDYGDDDSEVDPSTTSADWLDLGEESNASDEAADRGTPGAWQTITE